MPPRLLYVNHAAALGGGELSLLDLARRTPGASVALLEDGPFRNALEEARVPVDVVRAGGGLHGVSRSGGALRDLAAAPAAVSLAFRVARRARAADVVYANSQKASVVAALAGALARRPVVWHLRDILTAPSVSSSHRRLAAALANGPVARTIANSEATRAALLACGARPERVVTVHNGIDPAAFDAAAAGGASIREGLGVGDAPLVGVFSRLATWKGQHVLVSALAHLPDVHVLLVGDALFGGDAAYPDALGRLAARLGVADRVHAVGFRHDVPALLRAVDVVAHTSVEPEPFGRVIVEGMLARRPVVATDAGGAAEVVEDGRTGLLVPPGDPFALARALRALLDDPDRAARLAEAGRRAAETHFSLERTVAACLRHAAEAAGSTVPSPAVLVPDPA